MALTYFWGWKPVIPLFFFPAVYNLMVLDYNLGCGWQERNFIPSQQVDDQWKWRAWASSTAEGVEQFITSKFIGKFSEEVVMNSRYELLCWPPMSKRLARKSATLNTSQYRRGLCSFTVTLVKDNFTLPWAKQNQFTNKNLSRLLNNLSDQIGLAVSSWAASQSIYTWE